MNTKSVFKNCEYDDKVIKQNISFYLEQCVGYKVDPDNVSFFKVIIDDIDNFLVILKDDVRRLSKKNGGSGVLRQRQWSIFVFNFIDRNVYINYFGTNKNKKPIYDSIKMTNYDSFSYAFSTSQFSHKNPNDIYRNKSINNLLHNFIYLKLKSKFRYLFLNTYVYSAIGIINCDELKRDSFTTYYYNTEHVFKPCPNQNRIINQKIDINRTSILISGVKTELKTIETNYIDMSSLVNAYTDDLPLNNITSNNYNSIYQDILNKEHYIITEGTARTGKTIIAMRLLGKFNNSRLLIMNEVFYKSLISAFKVENVEFPTDRITCHTHFNKMEDWLCNSSILIIDEVQRLQTNQIEKLKNNKNNVNVLLGDDLQAINPKFDRGVKKIETILLNNNIEYKKYYFDHSIGISSNVLFALKYLIYNKIPFNNQNINNYDINIYDNENEFINKYKNDLTYRKHMATIYMGDQDYGNTIKGFIRWRASELKQYSYFLDESVKKEVMITTYELISRELDTVYIYLPYTVTVDCDGLHYKGNPFYDKFLLNQIYVLCTRAKGEINIYCESKIVYEYLFNRNQKIIKTDKAISILTDEENKKRILLENIIVERGITRLIHFTPKENLPSIQKNGIMSVKTMKDKGISYVHNDNYRFDKTTDGISLSIQNPNQFILMKFKKQYNNRDYVCLILDPALLYEITDESGTHLAPRKYCNYNAAALCTEEDDENIEIMFKDNITAGSWMNTRIYNRCSKDDNATTTDQAEILFRSTIDPKYILDIKEI